MNAAECFVDTQRPITPAEIAGRRFYLALHRDKWRAARVMFRRACQGEEPGANLLPFVADSGLDDAVVLVHLEQVLRDLAEEESGPYGRVD